MGKIKLITQSPVPSHQSPVTSHQSPVPNHVLKIICPLKSATSLILNGPAV
ncbi:MAG: hypothetical protein ACKPEO_10770 [Sphaerospermopsis kisseleviana]